MAIKLLHGLLTPRDQEWELVVFYLVVGQMFVMIVPCLVYLLTLLSFL